MSPQARNSSINTIILRAVDIACIFVGLALASAIWKRLGTDQYFIGALCATILFVISSSLFGTYRQWRGALLLNEVSNLCFAWGTAMVGLVVAGAITLYGSGMTRISFAIWAVATSVLFAVTRWMSRILLSHLYENGFNQRGFAVVGVTRIGINLAENIIDTPQLGLRFLGFYDDRPEERIDDVPESLLGRLGNVQDLVQRAKNGDVNNIYITYPMRAEERIRTALDALSDTTASVFFVPDFLVFEMLHSRWTNIQGLPVVSIFESPIYGIDGLMKRAFDFTIAALLLIVLSIPMSIIALLVKLTSPGPVFFRQKRYGLDGAEIPVWKFRSMAVCENGADVKQATKGDSRITRVGAVLRKTSLDELPQLFNVIAGDMSLVGPRPHASSHNEMYRKLIHGYMLRHKVKPGITGLAQVEGWRGETDTLEKMEKRVEFDHKYIREWNPLLDLRILFKTVFVVLKQENAY